MSKSDPERITANDVPWKTSHTDEVIRNWGLMTLFYAAFGRTLNHAKEGDPLDGHIQAAMLTAEAREQQTWDDNNVEFKNAPFMKAQMYANSIIKQAAKIVR